MLQASRRQVGGRTREQSRDEYPTSAQRIRGHCRGDTAAATKDEIVMRTQVSQTMTSHTLIAECRVASPSTRGVTRTKRPKANKCAVSQSPTARRDRVERAAARISSRKYHQARITATNAATTAARREIRRSKDQIARPARVINAHPRVESHRQGSHFRKQQCGEAGPEEISWNPPFAIDGGVGMGWNGPSQRTGPVLIRRDGR